MGSLLLLTSLVTVPSLFRMKLLGKRLCASECVCVGMLQAVVHLGVGVGLGRRLNMS